MSTRSVVLTFGGLVLLCGGGCNLFAPAADPATLVTIKLVNDSETQSVQPHLRICPQGMLTEPHYPLANPPLLAPGRSATYTSAEIAGASGNCQTFSADFMVGLCGWGYGGDPANLLDTAQRFGGQIGMQFYCGDTVVLHWTDGGADGTGTWTAEVQSGAGNAAPAAAFQLL